MKIKVIGDKGQGTSFTFESTYVPQVGTTIQMIYDDMPNSPTQELTVTAVFPVMEQAVVFGTAWVKWIIIEVAEQLKDLTPSS